MPNLLARLRGGLRTFKDDLRSPLEGAEGMSRRQRISRRFQFLLKKYGWKLLVAIFFYYLIRDLILYVLLPYLVATRLLCE
jgi:hypothetical protein